LPSKADSGKRPRRSGHDPLTIEQAFATLRHLLPLCSGRRLRLLHITGFLEPLLDEGGDRFIEAYFPEVLPWLLANVLGADLTGTNPLFLRRVARVIDGCLASVHGSLDDSSVDLMRTRLRSAIQQAEECGMPSKRDVPWPGPSAKIAIPLVERETLVRNAPVAFGTLGLLSFVVVKAGAPQADRLFVGHLRSGEDAAGIESDRILQAAHALVRGIVGRNGISAVRVVASLNRPELLEGDSMELGLAAGAACGIMRVVGFKEEYAVRPDVALTGCVDASGAVGPVDEEALAVKVEACLFSPVRILVVPKDQEEAAQSVLRRLTAAIGEGSTPMAPGLMIVGVHTLEEVFQDRRLTASRHVPVYLRAVRAVWNRRRLVAVAIILVMAVAIARLVYGPLDKRPAQVSFEGVSMIVKNAEDQVIRRVEVGERTVIHAHQDLARYATLADVNDDGFKEVVYLVAPPGKADEAFVVRCWSAKGDRVLWSTPVTASTVFPLHPSGTGIRYYARQVIADDCDGDGVVDVWVSANSSSFANIILKLDGQSGAIRGTYLHPGHLSAIAVMDLHGDGMKEVLAVGVNNAFLSACLVVLDPRDPEGVGPVQGSYVPEGVPSAHHLCYLLIPRTMVGEAFQDRLRANYGWDIWPVQEGKVRVRLIIRDADYLEKSCFSETTAHFYMDLDSSMTPISLNMGNDYHVMANTLVRMGKIPFDPSNDLAYHRAYMGSVKYWDGKGWVLRTIN
jgi:hypothetical protein